MRRTLKDIRCQFKYSQEKVARKLEVALSTYSNWEAGITKIPVTIVKLLAKFYEMKEEEIYRAAVTTSEVNINGKTN